MSLNLHCWVLVLSTENQYNLTIWTVYNHELIPEEKNKAERSQAHFSYFAVATRFPRLTCTPLCHLPQLPQLEHSNGHGFA